MASTKGVNDRARSARLVIEMARADEEALGAALGGLYEGLGDGSVSWTEVVRALHERLGRAIEEAVESDRENEREKSEGAAARAERDETFEALYRELIDLRAATKLVYGESGLAALRFREGTPREEEAMLRQAKDVLDGMAGLASLVAVRSNVSIDLTGTRAALEEARAAAESALQGVVRERREGELSQVAKDDTMLAYDAIFSGTARALEGLYQLAGEPEKARRVRPSARRPGRTELAPPEAPEAAAEGPAEGGSPEETGSSAAAEGEDDGPEAS